MWHVMAFCWSNRLQNSFQQKENNPIMATDWDRETHCKAKWSRNLKTIFGPVVSEVKLPYFYLSCWENPKFITQSSQLSKRFNASHRSMAHFIWHSMLVGWYKLVAVLSLWIGLYTCHINNIITQKRRNYDLSRSHTFQFYSGLLVIWQRVVYFHPAGISEKLLGWKTILTKFYHGLWEIIFLRNDISKHKQKLYIWETINFIFYIREILTTSEFLSTLQDICDFTAFLLHIGQCSTICYKTPTLRYTGKV